MNRNQLILVLLISLLIFSIGFILRVESADLPGIDENKEFFTNEEGLPYMYELDSYYNYRLTENLLNHGYMGDTIINKTEWDSHSYYPPGVRMDYPPLIAYLTAFVYVLINLFSTSSLLDISFWLPAFFAPFAGIVAYLMVRKYTNDYGGFAAGILTVTAPVYFLRTVPGFFDTDMFNVLFPLLVVWFLFASLETKNVNKKITLAILAGGSIFVFAMAWNGWQYLFLILIVFLMGLVIYSKIKNKKGKDYSNYLITLLIFFVTAVLLITIFSGYLNVYKLFAGSLEFNKILFSNNVWYPWPDSYNAVSELQVPTLNMIISGIGPILLGMGLMGIILILRTLFNIEMRERYLKGFSNQFFIFIVIWTIMGFLTLLKGMRFLLMILPPLIISSGLFVGISISYLDCLKLKKSFIKIAAILFILVVITPPLVNINDSMGVLVPGINDDLWSAAQWIKSNTSNDTVIISSWSYGHFLTGVADRPVLFDGRLAYIETLPIRNIDNSYKFGTKSPTTAREYWIYKAFATDNVTLSKGIFNMLTCSGDESFLVIDNYTHNPKKSVNIMNNVLGLKKEDARDILIKKYSFKGYQADKILNLTHPQKKRQYALFISDSMLKIGNRVINYGSWDFEDRKPGNYTYSVGDIIQKGKKFESTNNVSMDLVSGNLKYGNSEPYCLINITNGIEKKTYMNDSSNICVILRMDQKLAVVMDKKFEKSIFTRLAIEKTNFDGFKSIYRNKSVCIWVND